MVVSEIHPRKIKLAVDKMLGWLARKLLILGFDTYLREDGLSTREFLDKALEEERIVITTSRYTYRVYRETRRLSPLKLIFSREVTQKLLLEKLSLLDIAPLRDMPLTRCTVCNLPLKEVSLKDVEDKVPDYVKLLYRDKLWICPGCGRVYWPGCHYKTMLMSVQRFLVS